MEERLDADAVARVLRRAHELEAARGLAADPGLDPGGVSPDALMAAADDVGIDPAAVREALALERFEHDVPDSRRLDRVVGAPQITVQRAIPRSVDDTLDAIQEWLISGYQMRCTRTGDNTVECRSRTGIGVRLRRAATEFTDDENIQPLDRIVVEAHARTDDSDGPMTIVRLTAIRRTTRSLRLGGGVAGGAAGIGAAAVGMTVGAPIWWAATLPLVGGGFLVARSGATHADRVDVEMVRVLSSVARSERPTGIVGRAARSVRAAIQSVRPDKK